MTEHLFCQRCNKWKDHEWHSEETDKSVVMKLKCTKCGKIKQMKTIPRGKRK